MYDLKSPLIKPAIEPAIKPAYPARYASTRNEHPTVYIVRDASRVGCRPKYVLHSYSSNVIHRPCAVLHFGGRAVEPHSDAPACCKG